MAITPSRLGQANKAGATDALWVTKWDAAVYEKFLVANKAEQFCHTVDLEAGDTYKFNYTWNVDANYHTVSAELEGELIAHNQKAITIYRPILSDIRIDKYDQLLNHFDPKAPYIRQQANKLGEVLDKNIWLEGLLGANQAANSPVTGAPGGYQITDAALGSSNAQESAEALYNAITEVNVRFDENNVPDGEKYVVVAPRKWHNLASAVQANGWGVSNGDYNNVQNMGDTLLINGVQVIKSNVFPEGEDLSADSAKHQYHQFNATNSVGLAFCRDAIGLVRKLNVFTEMEYMIEFQDYLLVSGVYAEPGWLRPECLIELQIA